MKSRDGVVGITTRYGLEGLGSNPGRGEIFRTCPEAHPASYTMGTGCFPRVKRPGRDVNYPTPCSAEVKERVELYLY